jgi:NADH-quinone oxidoreductase subunit H
MFDNIWFEIFVFPGFIFLLAWTFFVFYFARKVLAYLHKRVGPHFNGPAGSMQTVYDIFKLLTKENITPKTANQSSSISIY